MKTYKTWEVIKAMTENPTLRFTSSSFKHEKESYIFVSGANEIIWHYPGSEVNGKELTICTDVEWIKIQQSVPFMEAVKAYSEGKTIRCEVKCAKHTYKPNMFENKSISPLSDECDVAPSAQEILEGTWIIVD